MPRRGTALLLICGALIAGSAARARAEAPRNSDSVIALAPLPAPHLSIAAATAPRGARSPQVANRLSLALTVLPIAAGVAIGTTGVNEAAGGWLVAAGVLGGPAGGLVYGRCYRHAAAGVSLRTLGLMIAAAGVSIQIEVGGGGSALWGGLALYGASTAYDLWKAGDCTRKHNHQEDSEAALK